MPNQFVILLERYQGASSSTSDVSIETYALLVYILSSRPFKAKIQGYSACSEKIESIFGHFEVKKKKN
jgi:hypothetical protein